MKVIEPFSKKPPDRTAESLKIARQCLEHMPDGDYRIQDRKVTPPPRARIDESMEALIHHFKIFTEGFKVPAGETYVAVENPRGELGCYLVSDGSGRPYRMHIRGASFYNLQTLSTMVQNGQDNKAFVGVPIAHTFAQAGAGARAGTVTAPA